jgi:hypothetical protein
MKISKTKLRQIIKEELSTVRESDWYDDENETRADRKYADRDAGLGDLQSDEKFTGGTPEERLLILMKARKVLAAMSKEKLTALSKSLDAEQVAVLRHILANPMYAAQAKSDDAAWEKEVGPGGNEMELEEKFERRRYGKSAKKPEPKTPRDEKNLSQREKDALNSATGKKNQGRGGY